MDKKGKITLSVIIISIALASCFSIYFVVADEEAWTIEGNKVYVDDSKVYISAEPHTLGETFTCVDFPACDKLKGEVTFNVVSKVYSGNVDLTLGFDTEKIKPKKAQLYDPYSVDSTHEVCTTDNETEITTCEDITQTYFYEWKDISGSFDSVNYDYGEMNKWWYLRNVPVIAGKEYKIKVTLEVSKDANTKYWFAIKPSSETINQAINNGHLYALDPWINSTGQNQNKNYLDENLIAYWNFDENGSDITENGNDCAGSGAIHHNSGGIIGGVYNFTADASTNLTCVSDNLRLTEKNFTINFWYKSRSSSGNRRVWHLPNDGIDEYSYSLFQTAGNFQTILHDDGGHEADFTTSNNEGTMSGWNMLTKVVNSTSHCLWSNGTFIQCVDASSVGTIQYANSPVFRIGVKANGDQPFDGELDEIGIWNRTLNSSEITELWNSGAGISYIPSTASSGNYTITFNLTDGGTGGQLDTSAPGDDYGLYCDNGFSDSEIDDNPHTEINFGNGIIECTFSGLTADLEGFNYEYRDKTLNITADSNKTIEIPMSRVGGLTPEEHAWLEEVYNCLINGVGCA